MAAVHWKHKHLSDGAAAALGKLSGSTPTHCIQTDTYGIQ